MRVVAGLGNPGIEYRETRHNVGFVLVDMLAQEWKLDFKPKYQGLFAETVWEEERVFLLKPQTYMNLSGRAVKELLGFYKVPMANFLVIHDDMDLPVGRIRLRQRGSSGGHNGIRSVIAETGTEEFWRLKVGIGRPPAAWDPARFVLAPFGADEIKSLEEALGRAVAAVKLWLRGESSTAMNLYNR